MKRLSAEEIRHEFTEKSKSSLQEERKVLSELSLALHALKQQGIDVEFEPSSGVGSDSLKGPDNGGRTASFSGILRIGNSKFVLTHIIKKEGSVDSKVVKKDVSDLHISYYNSKLGPLDNRVHVFSLDKDPEAMISFQKLIISISAEEQAIQDSDVAHAFSYDSATPRLIRKKAISAL